MGTPRTWRQRVKRYVPDQGFLDSCRLVPRSLTAPQVIRLRPQEASTAALADAVAGFLASADLAESTKGLYGGTLQALVDELEHDIALDRIGRATIERHLKDRYGHAAPATYNRNLVAFGSFFRWWGFLSKRAESVG